MQDKEKISSIVIILAVDAGLGKISFIVIILADTARLRKDILAVDAGLGKITFIRIILVRSWVKMTLRLRQLIIVRDSRQVMNLKRLAVMLYPSVNEIGGGCSTHTRDMTRCSS